MRTYMALQVVCGVGVALMTLASVEGGVLQKAHEGASQKLNGGGNIGPPDAGSEWLQRGRWFGGQIWSRSPWPSR
ncbi:hypothetical protein [Stieleria mannarensis]|uniref:hypothetical protein n=1 Tax=Stieleria mannarensis TaxID=2755585 RepID=UPI001603E5C5|nr:hypothetical protein [Rhodopirellula sp. JC639]